MARRDLRSKRILLTGASSGIGHALAVQLAARGASLLLTARREDRLQAVAAECRAAAGAGPAEVQLLVGDITANTTRDALLAAVRTHWNDQLDVLINNAGAGAVGLFAEASAERLHTLMDVNFIAPVELIRGSLPALRRGQQPLIVNIGSVLGHVGVPKKSEYCASKFALRGFSDALRIELASESIDVLWVAPNTTSSEFFDQLIERQGKVAENPLSMTPAAVATKTIAAMRRGHPQRILTLSGRLLILLRRWFPRTVTRLLKMTG